MSLHHQEFFMFYNVENFYGPSELSSDVSHYQGDKYVKAQTWKYQNKLKKLSDVFELFKSELGKMPIIFGLAEIQGERVLADIKKLEILRDYLTIPIQHVDERGMSTAFFYNPKSIEILSVYHHAFDSLSIDNQYFYENISTRAVLQVTAKLGGEVIHFFLVHLPSKLKKKNHRPLIIKIIAHLKSKISALPQDEGVVIFGDFNMNPDEPLMLDLTIDKEFNKILTNSYSQLYKNKLFSTFHKNEGLLYDQFLISTHFEDEKFRVAFDSAQIFSAEKLRVKTGKNLARPQRAYSGTRYIGGYSDHFPVILSVLIRKKEKEKKY